MDDYHADNNNELWAWRFSRKKPIHRFGGIANLHTPNFYFVEISNNENILEYRESSAGYQ